METLIFDEIVGHLYCLYVHDIIDSVEYSFYLSRLYQFYKSNTTYTYAQAMIFIFGGSDYETCSCKKN